MIAVHLVCPPDSWFERSVAAIESAFSVILQQPKFFCSVVFIFPGNA